MTTYCPKCRQPVKSVPSNHKRKAFVYECGACGITVKIYTRID